MVEEDEYRSTYHAVVRRRCVFEKAILTHRCACACSTRFYLADREGISCQSQRTHQRCAGFLVLLRENARFALGITAVAPELPHAKEIKVQVGGLLGLQKAMDAQAADMPTVDDIYRLTNAAMGHYVSLADLPYEEIMQSIVVFKGREKRPRPEK